jgi:uncharacterized protein involved in exopolysaccharide biosynthesis
MAWNYEDIDPDWTKPTERNWLWFVLVTVMVTGLAALIGMLVLG